MASLWELFVALKADNSDLKRGLQGGRKDLNDFGSTAAAVGKQVAGALALGALAQSASAAARKFEEAGVDIARSTGATGEKLAGLEKSFANVYSQTAASAESVTAALTQISTRTGTTGKALEGLTLDLVKLAKTQKEDVATLAPLVTRVFGDWSIATDKQSSAMNFLRVTSQQTGVSVGRLSEQVVAAGAPLRSLGYSFEQSVALIGKFEKEGVNTELVLGGMKAALAKFAKEGVTDTAAAWQNFIQGVKNGAITFQQVVKEVGEKRATDVFKAIIEGRFEIDKTTDSFKKLADQSVESITTIKGELTKFAHAAEVKIMPFKDIIITAPYAVSAFALVYGSAQKLAGILAAGGTGAFLSLGAASALAGVVVMAKGIDDLAEKYKHLNELQKSDIQLAKEGNLGGRYLEPWTKAAGDAATSMLGFHVKVVAAAAAAQVSAEQIKNAWSKLGIKDIAGDLEETRQAFATLQSAGKLSGGQLADAMKILEEKAFNVRKALQGVSVDELLNRAASDEMKGALDRAVKSTLALFEAGQPWGKQLELQRDNTEDLTNKLADFNLRLKMTGESIRALTADQAGFAIDTAKFQGMLGGPGILINWSESSVSLRAAAERAGEFYQKIVSLREEGKATWLDQVNSYKLWTDAEKKAAGYVGEFVSSQKRAAEGLRQLWTEAANSIADGFTNALYAGKGFGQAMLTATTDIAKSITKDLVKGALVDLGHSLLGISTQGKGLTDIFRGLGGLLGIGGGLAKSAGGALVDASGQTAADWGFGIAGAAAPAATQAASSASGAAGTAISSTLGTVFSGITAGVSVISGIIGGIQQAHANDLLAKIEESTRYLKVGLIDGNNSPIALNIGLTKDRITEIQQYFLGVQQNLLADMKDGIGRLAGLIAGQRFADVSSFGGPSLALAGDYAPPVAAALAMRAPGNVVAIHNNFHAPIYGGKRGMDELSDAQFRRFRQRGLGTNNRG